MIGLFYVFLVFHLKKGNYFFKIIKILFIVGSNKEKSKRIFIIYRQELIHVSGSGIQNVQLRSYFLTFINKIFAKAYKRKKLYLLKSTIF